MAIQFAENKRENKLMFDLMKMAGDFYFKEGQYDRAVEYFIRTIPALENTQIDS